MRRLLSDLLPQPKSAHLLVFCLGRSHVATLGSWPRDSRRLNAMGRRGLCHADGVTWPPGHSAAGGAADPDSVTTSAGREAPAVFVAVCRVRQARRGRTGRRCWNSARHLREHQALAVSERRDSNRRKRAENDALQGERLCPRNDERASSPRKLLTLANSPTCTIPWYHRPYGVIWAPSPLRHRLSTLIRDPPLTFGQSQGDVPFCEETPKWQPASAAQPRPEPRHETWAAVVRNQWW
jgi:hypothetical protein